MALVSTVFLGSPTPEYRRRHLVEAPAIDAQIPPLLAAQIAPRCSRRRRFHRQSPFEAGRRYEAWHETVDRVRTQPLRTDRIDGAVRTAITEFELGAAHQISAAHQAVGPERVQVLRLTLLDNRSWPAIAEALGCGCPKTAKARVAEALTALARHLAGEPVPPYRRSPRGRKRRS
jgi:hypothetical protein